MEYQCKNCKRFIKAQGIGSHLKSCVPNYDPDTFEDHIVAPPTKTPLAVTVSQEGSDLRLSVKADKLLGHLIVSKSGLRFIPPNTKRESDSKITWAGLASLMSIEQGFFE